MIRSGNLQTILCLLPGIQSGSQGKDCKVKAGQETYRAAFTGYDHSVEGSAVTMPHSWIRECYYLPTCLLVRCLLLQWKNSFSLSLLLSHVSGTVIYKCLWLLYTLPSFCFCVETEDVQDVSCSGVPLAFFNYCWLIVRNKEHEYLYS